MTRRCQLSLSIAEVWEGSTGPRECHRGPESTRHAWRNIYLQWTRRPVSLSFQVKRVFGWCDTFKNKAGDSHRSTMGTWRTSCALSWRTRCKIKGPHISHNFTAQLRFFQFSVLCKAQGNTPFIMVIVVGSPIPADEFFLDEIFPAVQMKLETRRGCSCLLWSRVLNYGRYSGDYSGLILWIPWAEYWCTLLRMVCWQCNVLVLSLDQEACITLSLFFSFLTWSTLLLTLRSSKFGYFLYYVNRAWHGWRGGCRSVLGKHRLHYMYSYECLQCTRHGQILTLGRDRFDTLELCTTCKLFLCGTLQTEAYIPPIGLLLSVSGTMFSFLSMILIISEVYLIPLSDKVSLEWTSQLLHQLRRNRRTFFFFFFQFWVWDCIAKLQVFPCDHLVVCRTSIIISLLTK